MFLILVWFALCFFVGAFVGSFLNVLVDRFYQGQNPFWGRSKCDFCDKSLSVKHLIPIFSFLFLKGRCAYCKKSLSLYYPFSEVLTGLFFVFALYISNFWRHQGVLNFLLWVYYAIIFASFAAIFLSDLKYQIIPNQIIYFLIIFIFVWQTCSIIFWSYEYKSILQSDELGKYLLQTDFYKINVLAQVKGFLYNILSGVGISLFFYTLIVLTKGRGMGGGDVKLGLVIGLFNGFPNGIIAVFLAFLLGSIVSLGLMLVSKKGLKDVIPFGPFLILGSMLSLIYGDWIFTTYISF